MSEERVLSDFVWTPERGENDPEIRSISWNNLLLSDEVYGGKFLTAAEVRINPDTALQSSVFLACARILSETISSLPINVHRRLKNGHEEIASDIPLHHVLSFAPNSWQTKFEFYEQLVMNLVCWGNSYSEIKSGRYGSVTELNNLHPSRMRVERLENGRLKYSYNDPQTGRLYQYTQDQVMHVRWTPEPDGIKGMCPVEISRDAIALARACEIYASKFWANMGRPGVVLQTDGALSAETAERLRDNWERIHRGVQNAYKTAVLTNGLKVETFGANNTDSQFLEVRKFQCEEVARCFRMPLSLIQGQSDGNPEVRGQEFVTYTLVPWLSRIEQSISRSLIYDDATYFAKFDVRGLMRGDSSSRASYLSTMMNLGVYTLNDARRHEGLPPIGENGDKHFIAMNVQPLEEAVKPKPDPSMMPGFGSGAPAKAPGVPPSLSDVKTGKAPPQSPKGEDSAKRSLTPRDEALEEAQVEIAEEDGKWDKESAHYIEKNPFASRGINCHNCTHYVEEGQCRIVSGAIDDNAICKLWVIPQEKIAAEPEKRAFCATGEGGGIDNSCGGEGAVSIPAGDASLKNYKPFASIGDTKNSEFAKIPSEDEVKAAINVKQREKFGAQRELEAGYPLDLRIDINAFKNHKVYAVTAHEHTEGAGVGKAIGYDTHIRLKGPVQFVSNENQAQKIGEGKSKDTHSTVKGSFDPSRAVPKDIDSWTPVGYDPYKAVYYYDKRTGDEVVGGTHALSVGNTVFTTSPVYGNAKEPGKPPRNAYRDYRSSSENGEARAFCPTGDDGGIDNSCSPKDAGKGDDDAPASEPKGEGGCPAPCHTTDVHADKNEDGVTDAARVGVPAMEVPPPPGVPRIPNLDDHARRAEEAFIAHFEEDPDGVASQFRELVVKQGDPPTFGTDDAKCLTTAWSSEDPDARAENRATLNTALHQCANAIAKRAFLDHLDTLKKGDSIMVTVGGCGAGKGFALKNNPAALELKNQSKAVWDSAGDQNATENPWIQSEAEKRGLSVTYVYVHADPKVQWADPSRGVVKRASDPKDGRMVDAKVFADSYAIGAKNHHAFHQANKDNPSAKFVFLDNTGKPKEIPGVPKEARELDADELAKFAEAEVEKSQAPERVKKGALQGRRIWK